jgi:lipopolysaccharide export LptBFGC system permease protein LptF
MRLFFYLAKAIALPFAYLLGLTALLAVGWQLARVGNITLIAASEGGAFFRLLLYLMPAVAQAAFPAALLAAVIFAYERLAADSELIALRAAGASIFRLLLPPLALGLVVALFLMAVAAWAFPRAVQGFHRDMAELAVRSFQSDLKPGAFSRLGEEALLFHRQDEAAPDDETAWSDTLIVLEPPDLPGTRWLIFSQGTRLSAFAKDKRVQFDTEDGTLLLWGQDTVDRVHFGSGAMEVDVKKWVKTQTRAFHHFHAWDVGRLWKKRDKVKRADRARVKFFLFEKFGLPLQVAGFALLGALFTLDPVRRRRGVTWGLAVFLFVATYGVHQFLRGLFIAGKIPLVVAPFGTAALLFALAGIQSLRLRFGSGG